VSEIAADANPYRALFDGHARYVPKTPWRPIPALFVTFLACAIPVIVYAILLEAIALVGGSEADVERWSAEATSLASPGGLAIIVFSQALSLWVFWAAAGWRNMRHEALRLAPPKAGWSTCVFGGLILIAAVAALELALYASVGFDPFADSEWLLAGLESPYWWGTVLVAVVLAPLWEEIAFRGFLLSALAKSRLGYWPAAVISTALWTGLHWGYSWAGLASVFAAGMGLSWLMWRLGSLRAVVVAHGLANVAALLFTYFLAPAR
jgi:membrane protease YdiL (CAAX protease family)